MSEQSLLQVKNISVSIDELPILHGINLNIKAEGDNEHHKIESIFKAFAKCLKSAVKRDSEKMILPSTKGML